jgi:Chlorophyll A-B binding protein
MLFSVYYCRSDIQTDLKYARWSELKHGRICMLAIVGMVIQQSGLHVPGEQFTNKDIFGAVSSVGWAANLQIFMAIGCIEALTFNMHYGEGEPGAIGWEPKSWATATTEFKKNRMEQEIVHCRLAMIAFTGAMVQTLLYGEPLLG